MAFFSFKMYLYWIFWLEFEISASELTHVPHCLRIDPCTTFQLNWTKNKGTRILTWNSNTKNSLMTSYLPPNDDVSKFLWLLREFFPEFHHSVVIEPQTKYDFLGWSNLRSTIPDPEMTIQKLRSRNDHPETAIQK